MEQMPQSHHREGIQNELDKAYDEGHQDNKALDEARAKIEEIKEGTQEELDKEYGGYDEGQRDNEALDEAQAKIVAIKGEEVEEMQGKLSLEETVMLLEKEGVLDTSFDGKKIHRVEIRPLTKEEALSKFDHSGGRVWINPDVENVSYVIPKAETLDVIIVHFGYVDGAKALAKMDKLGVRPLTVEELIQYGIAYPEHQKQQTLVVFGPNGEKDLKLSFADTYYREATRTREKGDVRWLDTIYAGQHGKYHFPVVRK